MTTLSIAERERVEKHFETRLSELEHFNRETISTVIESHRFKYKLYYIDAEDDEVIVYCYHSNYGYAIVTYFIEDDELELEMTWT